MDTGETARRERERSTPFGTTMAVARRTASGQEELFPFPRSSVGSRFSNRTLVGTLGNGQDAPKAATGQPRSSHGPKRS